MMQMCKGTRLLNQHRLVVHKMLLSCLGVQHTSIPSACKDTQHSRSAFDNLAYLQHHTNRQSCQCHLEQHPARLSFLSMLLCLLVAAVLISGPHRKAKTWTGQDHNQDLHERGSGVDSPVRCNYMCAPVELLEELMVLS